MRPFSLSPVFALALCVVSTTARAEDPKPADAKPADAKPADTKPADAKPAAPAPPPGDVPELKFEKYTLENGLEVILHEDKRLPVVCVSVWYHVGALHEEKGKSGFAHLFEHLMFQGTPHIPGDAHFKYLEEAGGSFINGSTNNHFTNYFETVPKNELELALWLESDRMGWLGEAVDQAKLDEQRGVVKNERRQSVENVPYGLGEEKLWQAMYPPEHPYWGMVIGTMADLDKAALTDVRAFFDNYYAPSNATLTIAGDFDAATVKTLVEKYFKTLPKWPKPAAKTVPSPTIAQEIRVDAEDGSAQLAKVEVQYFAPATFAPGDADLDVAAHILGRGNNSRLHQALMVDAALAQEVSASNMSDPNGSVFNISAVVSPGVDPETVLSAIQSQIDLFKDIPPSAEEVARAVNTREAETVFGLQLVLSRAETLQMYNHLTGDPAYLAKDLARYKAVTPDTVVAATTAHLAKERRAVLVVKPKSAAPAAEPAKEPAKETK